MMYKMCKNIEDRMRGYTKNWKATHNRWTRIHCGRRGKSGSQSRWRILLSLDFLNEWNMLSMLHLIPKIIVDRWHIYVTRSSTNQRVITIQAKDEKRWNRTRRAHACARAHAWANYRGTISMLLLHETPIHKSLEGHGINICISI